MAKTFSNSDAKSLIKQHRELINKLDKFKTDHENIEKQLFSQLNINIANRTFLKQLKANLFSDNNDFDNGIFGFLKTMYAYKESCKCITIIDEINKEYRKEIELNISVLSAGAGSLKWLFASQEKKDKAEEAYTYLESLISSGYADNINENIKSLNDISVKSNNEIIEDINSDSASYIRIYKNKLISKCQNATVLPEISDILKKFDSVDVYVNKAKVDKENVRGAIIEAVKGVKVDKVYEALDSIPVEALGKEIPGLRVKALTDNGYNTVKDLTNLTPQQIAETKGVSEEGAVKIKDSLRNYIENIAKNTKISLSVDNKNDRASELVKSVYRYRQKKGIYKRVEVLSQPPYPEFVSDIEDIRNISNGVLWIFTSDDSKNKIKEAYKRVESNYIASDSAELGSTVAMLSQYDNPAYGDYWNDFEKNSIDYFSELEEIVPGLVDDNKLYGLPEDFAKEVQTQSCELEGLNVTLRSYQEMGVKYILHQGRVLLGDEMGLGKTVQALASMVSLRNQGETHFMVVCPASVLANWCKEIESKSNLTAIKVHGSDREKAFSLWKEKGGVAVTTYETTGVLSFEDSEKFSMLVVDEAHYIKNINAKRSQNVRNICTHAEKILFMTGTALENKVDEMISLIEILNKETSQEIKKIAFMSTAPQFKDKIVSVYYRRKRDDVLTELPEKEEKEEWCTLFPKEKEIYEENILNKKYTDARRVSWNVDDLSQSSKAQRVLEIVNDAAEDGRKVIIFSFFLDTIEKVRTLLGDRCLEPINGSVEPAKRQEIVENFEKAPAGSVLCAQIISGGTGLNIQSASVVIICEPQFKPSIENQAISRAYRMGQTRNVLVHRMLCVDTIDEKITEMLKYKQSVFDAFADESVAASAEETEIDNKKFSEMIDEEIDRIVKERNTMMSSEVNDNGEEKTVPNTEV